MGTLMESIISGKETAVKTSMKFSEVAKIDNNGKITKLKNEETPEINFIESFSDNKKAPEAPKKTSPIGRVEKEEKERNYEIPEIIKHQKFEDRKLIKKNNNFLGNISEMNSVDIFNIIDQLLKRFNDSLRLGFYDKNSLTNQTWKKVPVQKTQQENE